VEISNGFLRVNTIQSSAPDLNINLTSYGYDTLGGLVEKLKEHKDYYCVTPDGEMHRDHPSCDLQIITGDLLRGGVSLNHRRFSDKELTRVLQLAAQRQNINYTVSTVPETEFVFVCTLAAADICRIMAQDAVKRRGLSMDVSALLEMAKSYEEQWNRDVKWQRRAINVAKIKDSDTRKGDVMVGTIYRPSLRTWYQTPNAVNDEPEVPCLHDPEPQDIQDQQIRLTWDPVRDTDFYGMELWRDTVDDVQRSQLGNVTIENADARYGGTLPTTSKLVFASVGSTTRYGRSVLTQYGEATGQSVNTFVDGHDNSEHVRVTPVHTNAPPPDPETTYYYKLYTFDRNRIASGSNVVQARTKRLRARLSRDGSVPQIDPSMGPIAGGTPITLKGTRFHDGMRVRLGDKMVENLVVVDSETATATTPEVLNESIISLPLDLSITSDTGLVDMASEAFKYTE
jgi:hypothetical protein